MGQILDYAKPADQLVVRCSRDEGSDRCAVPGTNLLSCFALPLPQSGRGGLRRRCGAQPVRGNFLLIIAGDGIRYGAESLVAILEKSLEGLHHGSVDEEFLIRSGRLQISLRNLRDTGHPTNLFLKSRDQCEIFLDVPPD